jgi:hypothetical protein
LSGLEFVVVSCYSNIRRDCGVLVRPTGLKSQHPIRIDKTFRLPV